MLKSKLNVPIIFRKQTKEIKELEDILLKTINLLPDLYINKDVVITYWCRNGTKIKESNKMLNETQAHAIRYKKDGHIQHGIY